MVTVLSVLQVFIAVILILLILLHSGKDAGMSGAFGVGGPPAALRRLADGAQPGPLDHPVRGRVRPEHDRAAQALAPVRARRRRARAAPRGPARGGVRSSSGRSAAASAHASSAAASTPSSAQPRRPGAARTGPRRARRDRRPSASPSRSHPRGEAPGERAERVRQHDRVGRAVADAGEPHERLGEHVVQAVDGRVDRVAGQQRRRAPARRGPARRSRAEGAGDQPRRLERGQRRDRVGARRARPLGGVPERVQRARGQLGLRLGGRQRGVVDDDRAGARWRRPRARRRRCRCTRVISAPESVVGIAIARAAPREARRERLRDVDHAAAAERDDAVVRDRARAARRPARRPARARPRAPPPAASTTSGRARRGPARSSAARSPGPPSTPTASAAAPAAEADRPLAVLPGESLAARPRPGRISRWTAAATPRGTARRSGRCRDRARRPRRARAPRSRAGPSRRPAGCGGAR